MSSDSCIHTSFSFTATALANNTGFAELRLEYCKLREEDTQCVLEAVSDLSTLKSLDLSGNRVNSQVAKCLGKYQ